jgi:hypothetical protein
MYVPTPILIKLAFSGSPSLNPARGCQEGLINKTFKSIFVDIFTVGNLDGCRHWNQGCQMVYFQTKKSQLGKFCRALQWKMFVYFVGIGVLYGILIYLMDILNILW